MIHSDFHLHTSHSSDSQASMESMILKAIDLGLTKICFTEHQDYGYPENKENFDFLVEELEKAIQDKIFDMKKKKDEIN